MILPLLSSSPSPTVTVSITIILYRRKVLHINSAFRHPNPSSSLSHLPRFVIISRGSEQKEQRKIDRRELCSQVKYENRRRVVVKQGGLSRSWESQRTASQAFCAGRKKDRIKGAGMVCESSLCNIKRWLIEYSCFEQSVGDAGDREIVSVLGVRVAIAATLVRIGKEGFGIVQSSYSQAFFVLFVYRTVFEALF